VLVKTSAATLAVRYLHPVINDIAVHVHRRPDVGMAHEFLLHRSWRSYGIHPRAVGMPKRVCSERSDACFDRGIVEAAPVPRVRDG